MKSFMIFEKNRYVIFLTLFTFLLSIQIYPQQKFTNSNNTKITKSTYQLERDVFSLINKERRKRGLKKLSWNSSVAAMARKHSKDMARNRYFSHRSRDGKTVEHRAKKYGIRGWRGIGENLAYNFNSSSPAKMAVKGWMNSRGHRSNLLSSRWKETGIGVAEGRDGTYYFTEVFIMK